MNEPQKDLIRVLEDARPVQEVSQAQPAVARAVAEVQAGVVLALKTPRDPEAAYRQIIQNCRRPSLAERAVYEFPRGGNLVTGPSIHLVREIARHWKNIRSGLVEIQRENGASLVEAYAWDLEANIYDSRRFWVKHERKRGQLVVRLEDPRDIYEAIAAQGARYIRACLLSVLPSDIVEAAMEVCEKTMLEQLKGNTDQARQAMIKAFAEIGVPEASLNKFLGIPARRATPRQIFRLRRVYQAIKDGLVRAQDIFDLTVAPPPEKPKQRRGRRKKEPETKLELGPESVQEPEPQPEEQPVEEVKDEEPEEPKQDETVQEDLL